MNDLDKSKDQLLDELKALRQRVDDLEDSEEKLQAMKFTVDHAMDPVVWIAPNGRYLYVNDAACGHVKHSREKLLSMQVSDLDPNFPPEKWREHFEELKKVGSKNLQSHHIAGDGKKKYVDLRSNYIKFGDNEFICSCVYDITKSKHAEQAVAEQLEFERLIADIASQLAQTRPEQLDESIASTLQALGLFFGTQRAFLAQFTNDGKSLFHRKIWSAEGIDVPPYYFEMDMAAASPWFAQQVRLGKAINTGPGLVNLPDESGVLRERLKRDGVNSGVIVPVRVEDRSLGMLGLDTVDQPRDFKPSIVDRLKIVADTVGSMLHRVQVQTQLQESEMRFRAFMDNLPAHAYIKDNSDRHLFANKTTLAFLGKKINEFIGLKSNDIWPEAVSEKIKHLDRKVLTGEQARVVEEWSHVHLGETHWIRDIKFPIQLSEDEKLLGGIGIDITESKRAEEELEAAFSEIKRLNTKLEAENVYLREEIELQHRHVEIVGTSKAVRKMLGRAEQVAGADSTVLILGETGTGKELLARAIHRMSPRSNLPMITVNCAALPSSLIESEMFGRDKGAFTGALTGRVGRFEIADGSTIFLDEIGELKPDVQIKLLRVLEKGQFERLGSNKTIKVDVRIIAATNRDLVKAVHEGGFRRDLFYRLNVFPIHVPSLQDRIEDLDMLLWAFVKEFGERMGKRIEIIPRKSIEALKRCPWQGNIRELRNVIEQSMIVTRGSTLNVQLPGSKEIIDSQSVLLKDVERNHILKIMKQTGWRVRGKAGAAELLGLKPTTLDARMKKLGVVRPK